VGVPFIILYKISPAYYEEEVAEDTDPSLFDEYVLMDLEHETTILPESFDVVTEVLYHTCQQLSFPLSNIHHGSQKGRRNCIQFLSHS